MDVEIETGIFPGSSHGVFGVAPKAASLGGSLMRYHSAPSSVFAALLDDDFEPSVDDSEFARLLNDGIGSLSSLVDSKSPPHQHAASQPGFNAMAKQDDLLHGNSNNQHSEYCGSGASFREHLSSNRPLSVISEYGLEANVKDFCVPLPSSEVAQQAPVKPAFVDGLDFERGCSESQATAVLFDSAPVQQSSFPSDALSRLVTDEDDNMAKLAGSCVPVADDKIAAQNILRTHQSTMANILSDIKCGKGFTSVSSPKRSVALLRQSSSPAGLLSQINIEDLMLSKEKRAKECMPQMLSAEMMSNRKGLVVGQCHGLNMGNENFADQAMQHFLDLGQRKRGRGLDNKLVEGLQNSPIDLATVMMPGFSPSPSSSPGSADHLEGLAEESVLCKARAKRGCATHPRSIAERQRRTKINERMKKLQDLVPNLDRQASTAEMLDEIVEYVKLLQRQVQELSLNQPKCTGSCQQGSSSPH